MNLNLPPVHTAENQPPIARDNHPLQPNQIFIPSSGTIAQQKIDTSLSMRSPPNTPPNTLPKIAFISTDKFSINTIIAAKEKEYAAQAIQAPSVFSETHPLSALFWEATSTENSYTKINKLLDETINIFQNLSEKNKNKFSSQSLFRKYLLKKSSDIQKLLPLIKEQQNDIACLSDTYADIFALHCGRQSNAYFWKRSFFSLANGSNSCT